MLEISRVLGKGQDAPIDFELALKLKALIDSPKLGKRLLQPAQIGQVRVVGDALIQLYVLL